MTTPTKMTPGDELHLTLLMAPQGLNLVTGQDRQHLLAYGRAAFDAGRAAAEEVHLRELAAYQTTVANLERKVAELEAAPAAQAVEPEFFTVFASHNGGKIALPGYSNETEKGVKDLVLQAARQEGYKGTVSGRLLELGWWIGPVFASPSEAAAPAPAAVAVADGWQPIAAAQKSGRTLMLGFFNESGKWRTTRGQWFTQEHIDDTWEDADDCKAGWYETPVVGEDCYPVAPTHWMPLPAAPSSTPSTAAPDSPAAGAAQAVVPFDQWWSNGGGISVAAMAIEDGWRGAAEAGYNAALRAPQAAAAPAADFQQRVLPWMMACFGPAISADVSERNHRFLEEALELVQACGCTASEARQLVDYVYGRPLGEKHQEVGGVMVTLAALCLAQGLDMHAAGDTELARIWTKVDAIRAKQAAKPKHSPLPAAQEGQDALTQAARDVLAERVRQISTEGRTPEQDDRYRGCELAKAAAAYAHAATGLGWMVKENPPTVWPWPASWWKSTTARRDLEKAGALILAEMERIDRAAIAAQAAQGGA